MYGFPRSPLTLRAKSSSKQFLGRLGLFASAHLIEHLADQTECIYLVSPSCLPAGKLKSSARNAGYHPACIGTYSPSSSIRPRIGTSRGKPAGVSDAEARRQVRRDAFCWLPVAFGEQRTCAAEARGPHSTRMTQSGPHCGCQFALQQTAGRLFDHLVCAELDRR
jgi:hypothetical protein